jgi:hypothetical protein
MKGTQINPPTMSIQGMASFPTTSPANGGALNIRRKQPMIQAP